MSAARPVRVLIVDDHAPFRQAMGEMIETTPGFDVVALVASGEESVAVASAGGIDLVLMDVNLPGMSGLQASRTITAGGGGPVIVLVSTYGPDEFDAAEWGAAAYLDKSELTIERVLELWGAAGQG